MSTRDPADGEPMGLFAWWRRAFLGYLLLFGVGTLVLLLVEFAKGTPLSVRGVALGTLLMVAGTPLALSLINLAFEAVRRAGRDSD